MLEKITFLYVTRYYYFFSIRLIFTENTNDKVTTKTYGYHYLIQTFLIIIVRNYISDRYPRL